MNKRSISSGFIFLLAIAVVDANEFSCEQQWHELLGNVALEEKYLPLVNSCNSELKKVLRKVIGVQKKIDYTDARRLMFSKIDNDEGEVCGVYSGVCIKTTGIPSDGYMNCEHTWPQSLGGGDGLAKSDLHHLFPSLASMNSRRSNYPFCEVDRVTYSAYGSALGYEQDKKCFEPRDEHKGDAARAMLYMSVRYGLSINDREEAFLRKWHSLDPVSDKEVDRNNAIEEAQKNRNPFIDHPEFVELIENF